ncbi:hypothetical protein [Spiroplasma endosymbiont of Labia minor]|uniref:hypothetical protein n=1 Tax=Spiroplasma endosymbiont of Labia minor TaxID=3066305 RepID=UPI0030D0E7F5
MDENQGNDTVFNNFSKLEINFNLNDNLRYWDYNGNLVEQINSENLEMINIKKSVGDGSAIDIVNASSHSGLAYWEVQISVIFKIKNDALYVNFKNRVKIKIISSKMHTIKLQYGLDDLEFLQ